MSLNAINELDNKVMLLQVPTVARETLEGVFLLNNLVNIYHTTLKLSAMCLY